MDSFAYILSKTSLISTMAGFCFFICVQLNSLHQEAATRHFGFTKREGEEKCTFIKNSLKI